MADISRTVEIIFNAIDRTGGTLTQLGDDLDRIGTGGRDSLAGIADTAGKIEEVTGGLGDFGKKILAIEAASIAAGAAFVTFATVQAGQFQSAFNEIATLIGEDPANLQSFKNDLEEYAATSTQSLDIITNSVYAAISAGIDYEDSLSALSTAEKLSVAGKADLDATLVALVSTLNAYNVGTEEAASFSDLLFTTVKQGQTTLPELANSLSNVTSIAATAGVGFDEISAAIATLTASGAPTATAITGIRGAIASILKPTKEAQDAAAELGINFSAAALETNGLSGVLAEVAQKTGGSTVEIAKLFGGVEALQAVLPLTGVQAEKFSENLNAMSNSAGATEKAFQIMADNLDLQFQKVANAFNTILLGVGDPLIDEFGGIADAVSSIFLSIGQSIDNGALEKLVDYVEANLQDLQGVFDEIAKNLPQALEEADLSGFTNGIDAVKDAIGELFEGVDLTTPEGLKSVIEGLGTAFEFLGEFTAGFLGSFQTAVDFIKENKGTIGDSATEFANLAGQISGFAEQASLVAGAVGGLASSLEILVDILAIRAGANLLTSLGSATTALGGAGGLLALLGKGGLVGAAGAAGFAVGTWINEQTGLSDIIAETAADLTGLNDRIAELSQPTQIAVKATEDLRNAFSEASTDTDKVTDSLIKLFVPTEALPEAQEGVAVGAVMVAEALAEQAKESEYLKQVQEALTKSTEDDIVAQDTRAAIANEYAKELKGLVPIYDEVTGRITGFTEESKKQRDLQFKLGGILKEVNGDVTEFGDGLTAIGTNFERATGKIDKGTDALDKTAKAAEKAREEAQEFKLKMAELASDQQIALIESKFALDIAQVEADAVKLEAIFDSINATFESTGEVINTSIGVLGELAGSGTSRFTAGFKVIEEQLALENEIRQQAAEDQSRLINAQIEELETRTRRLQDGNALIEIDGAGLQPHLEAFMFEILESIQVRVNAEGYATLLGGPL